MINTSRSPGSFVSRGALQFPRVSARKHVLPNGLTLLVQEDRSAPVASVQAWVGAGSIHEGQHLGAGLSHLLEHMLFKGTERRTTNQIAQCVQDEGGYVNAYTSFDRTVYWIDVPKAGCATAIDLLADACMNSTLPADEFVKEQEVIRREFAMLADDPDRVNSHQLFATAYRVHPYRHPVIGHLDVFDQLTRDQLQAYYKARYVPNNLTFVVVGDVDAQAVLGQLETIFAPYPRAALPMIYLAQEPLQLGRREAHREFPTELSRVVVSWHIPGITHADVPALDVLATALGEGRSSRLYRLVREKLKLAHSISAFSYVPSEPGLFGFEATTDPDKREATEAAAMEIMGEIRRDGISEAELAKAKRVILSNQLNALVTMRGQASDLGSNWLLTGNLDFSRDYLRAIQDVRPEDAARVASAYLREENCTVASIDPLGAESRQRPKAAEAPAISAGPIQRFVLSNGMRLLVREDHRLPLVYVDAVFRGGLLAETPENNGLTKLFARVLVKGTKTRTAEEIADEIEAVGGTISSDAGNNSFSVSLEVMEPDLDMGLDLFADVLLNASLPESVIEREKAAQCAAIKGEDEHVTSIARNLLRATLFGAHPYALRTSGTVATVGSLTREDLLAFRAQHLSARNGVLAIFGDINAAEAVEKAEALFGALPEGELRLTEPPVASAASEAQFLEKIEPKEQAVLIVGYPGVSVSSPDRYALELIDEASSDLGSRFFIRIREELGLAYFVGSAQMLGLAPGLFSFYVGTDPRKIEQVREVFAGEIAHLAANGLDDAEFLRAKKKLVGKQAIAHQSNASLAYTAALDELYDLGYLHHLEVAQRLEKITAQEVREAANRYFQRQAPVTVVVRPEAPLDAAAVKAAVEVE
jgi:zinc protease